MHDICFVLFELLLKALLFLLLLFCSLKELFDEFLLWKYLFDLFELIGESSLLLEILFDELSEWFE